MSDFYQFEAETLNGDKRQLSDYKGQVVLVVNTASKCGFTPQYKGLQELYETYKNRGFTVLGFPCNQFGGQEPGDAEAINSFCELNYGVEFPMFDKIDVNGDHAHPLFNYLKDELSGTLGNKIKWNFTKFLIGRDGKPLKRYAPTTKPEKLTRDIEQALNA